MRRAGLWLSCLVIAIQWLVVSGFISHSYAWWMKASDPQITAGISGTVAMFAAAAAAIVYTLWQYVRIPPTQVWRRVGVLLMALAGLTGQLVYFGMASAGIVVRVHR